AMTLAGALTVAGGATMRVTSAGTVTLDGGGSVSGLLDLEPAATLALADGTTLAVNGAGTLEVKGTGPLDRPVITGSTSTAAFTVTVNGALDADQFTVQRGRLVFGASATVTGLNRGRFLSHPGSGLAYVDFSSYNGVNLEFMTLEFGNANGRPNARNVKGPGGPHITCEAAFGVLSGERFDDDVANRVHWQTTPRTVMIGSTTYPSINAALAAAVANDTITIADNALHRGNFVLNKNGLTLQGGLIEGNVDTDGVATGVKLRNLFVVGAIGATNGPNLVEHCSVYNATAANGTITAAGAGNQARYSIATGAITATTSTQNVASAVAAANFINPGAGDLHLKPGSAAIGLAALSTVNSDIDGATRPDGAARDAGADEFASNNAGAILWDSANFGPVSQSFKEWWGDYAWVATGTLDADAAGAWQNALALVNVNTGAVLAGICSTGASPPANVGFPAGFTIPGPVSRVRGWYDAANNQHLLYFTIDSDSDGRDDTLRKIRTPGTPYAMPTWASATVEWSFTVSEGPLGAFEFTTASPWDMIVIADQDTGREPSGNPVLYKLSGATGAILATNNSYPWNYAGGINSLTSNGFFAAIKSGAAGGEDIARLDQDLAVLQAVDLGGAAGLEQAPTAVMFGGARVYAPTPNQQVHALLVSNLNADTAFSTDGVFDLVADGVVPGGDSPVNSTAVLCAFGVRWVFVGYAVGDVGYVAKIRDAPTPTIGDADFSLGARVPIRGQPLMPLSIDKRVGRLSVLTTDGRMVVLTFNNSLTDTPGDGALYSGFPRKVPGAGARSIMWTVTTTVGTVALVGVDGDRLLAMKHK
ncbi:MAG: hypothetical protein HY719_05470, partial [Planctomycetes bacterium]|nr:hypothetical protein [Planctomycetota bacterium]